mmetsp:Transcript_31956/g.101888  ORF Transcript_31956/g.101888 Transcript_31956/m.101888 type:complete len:139 (+) Transcript_31956:182-598(+)
MVKAMCNAFLCCFSEIDTDDILIGCKGMNECLCIEEKCCIAANEALFPIGLVPDDKFLLKLGLPCCTCGIKIPDVLCLGYSKCLCCINANAFPFKDPVNAPVCAICFVSLLPEVGLLLPAPSSGAKPAGAPPAAEMER